jgi:hypothetical protein
MLKKLIATKIVSKVFVGESRSFLVSLKKKKYIELKGKMLMCPSFVHALRDWNLCVVFVAI